MDINSKIHLSPGVQLTAETLNTLFDSFYQRQISSISSFSSGRIGVMPGYANTVRGAFVRDTIEVEIRDFMAVLPSGILLNIDDTAVVKVPLLYGDTYYLTVNTSDKVVHFESNGIPFVRNDYSFVISTFDDMVSSSSFPILRLNVKDGVFSIDEKYIMPTLVIAGNPRIAECIAEIAERIRTLVDHPNIVDCSYRSSLLNYLFRLTTMSSQMLVSGLIQTLREVAAAIDFFIVRPNSSDPVPVSEISPYDIVQWVTWFTGYIDNAGTILDGVVVEKEEIDLESIKQELRSEIYDHIQPDLERMVNERVDNLSEALQSRIEDVLKDYVNGKILGELQEALRLQLDADLRASLYADLYQSLSAVLFVPKEEEETFVPLI